MGGGAPAAAPPLPTPGHIPPPLYNFDQRRDDRRPDDRRRPKKKEGWLGELFDF